MSIEANTPNRNYPLPHEDNKTAFDVLRLIAALSAIDVDMATALIGLVSKAPLASPAFTGTPTAPTQTFGNDSNALATTAFVRAAVAALVNSSPATLDTLNELAAALGNDANFAATMTAALAGKANVAEVVKKVDAGLLTGFRNKIINGDFDLWQRGIVSQTFTGSGAGTFLADRWRLSGSAAGTTVTVTRQAHTLGQTAVPGNPQYFMRLDRTVTGGAIVGLSQPVEGVRNTQGKTMTLTLWSKGTVGKAFDVVATQSFGTGGSPSASVQVPVLTGAVLTGNWTKYMATVSLPSIAGKTLGSNANDFLAIDIFLPVAQGNMVLDLSRVSLVAGDATPEEDPFAARDAGTELNLCQRYYWRNLAGENLIQGHVTTAGAGYYMNFRHPVTMRGVPTMTASFSVSGNIGTPVLDRINPRTFLIGAVGAATGGAFSIDTSAPITADAEL